jgi:hypothetical protein
MNLSSLGGKSRVAFPFARENGWSGLLCKLLNLEDPTWARTSAQKYLREEVFDVNNPITFQVVDLAPSEVFAFVGWGSHGTG